MNLKCKNSYKCKNRHEYEKKSPEDVKNVTSNVKRCNKCEKLNPGIWWQELTLHPIHSIGVNIWKFSKVKLVKVATRRLPYLLPMGGLSEKFVSLYRGEWEICKYKYTWQRCGDNKPLMWQTFSWEAFTHVHNKRVKTFKEVVSRCFYNVLSDKRVEVGGWIFGRDIFRR